MSSLNQAKRLQVFISSTFVDLQEHRQAAVEAILMARHIPAGMELFTAGDQSQMDVIKRWIDDSDVFALILGGRYGSIEATSGKSYTHLEFDYARSKGKPLFVLAISNTMLEGLPAKNREQADSRKYNDFRSEVSEGRIVRFWEDAKDIKVYATQALFELSASHSLVGWIRGDAATSPEMAQELARLSSENAQLRARSFDGHYAGLTYSEMIRTLQSIHPVIEAGLPSIAEMGQRIVILQEKAGDPAPTLLHAFLYLSQDMENAHLQGPIASKLTQLGLFEPILAESYIGRGYYTKYLLTVDGKSFLNRCRIDSTLPKFDNLLIENGARLAPLDGASKTQDVAKEATDEP